MLEYPERRDISVIRTRGLSHSIGRGKLTFTSKNLSPLPSGTSNKKLPETIFWDRESYAARGSSCGDAGSGMMMPLYISSDVLPRMLRATLRCTRLIVAMVMS